MTTEEKTKQSSGKYELEKPLDETVLYEKITKDIATVTLNRPEKHNALFPPDMFYEVTRKIELAVDDDDVKVIILKGNGKSFCSGDDLNLAPYDTYGGAPGTKPSQRVRVKAMLTWLNGMYRALEILLESGQLIFFDPSFFDGINFGQRGLRHPPSRFPPPAPRSGPRPGRG